MEYLALVFVVAVIVTVGLIWFVNGQLDDAYAFKDYPEDDDDC